MDLITASLTLDSRHPTLSAPDICTDITTRLQALPHVEHVRTRRTGDTVGVGIFYTCSRDQLPALRAAITDQISAITEPISN